MTGLAQRLQERIQTEGPMRFRDWMEAALYDPEAGYYMGPGRKTGAGPDADFATSPTLHPFMAEAIAKEAIAAWTAMGCPARFEVHEFGGGEGDLARDCLAAIDAQSRDLAAAIQWRHVEISPSHIDAQASSSEARISHVARPARLDGLVVAHEFLDALPVHLLERRKGNWAEVFVAWDEDGGRFMETLGIPSRRAVEAAPKRVVPEGHRVTAMVDARSWVQEIGHAMSMGRVLIIDYGDRGNRLWTPDRADGTVRGFRNHTLIPDVLDGAGTVDITSSLDFTQIREWARSAGLSEVDLVSQETFLVEHGALEVLATAPRDTVEDASSYLRLKQMVIPTGMGSAFKVQKLEKGIGEAVADGDP